MFGNVTNNDKILSKVTEDTDVLRNIINVFGNITDKLPNIFIEPRYDRIGVICLLALLCVIGTLGNLLVMIAIALDKTLR